MKNSFFSKLKARSLAFYYFTNGVRLWTTITHLFLFLLFLGFGFLEAWCFLGCIPSALYFILSRFNKTYQYSRMGWNVYRQQKNGLVGGLKKVIYIKKD